MIKHLENGAERESVAGGQSRRYLKGIEQSRHFSRAHVRASDKHVSKVIIIHHPSAILSVPLV